MVSDFKEIEDFRCETSGSIDSREFLCALASCAAPPGIEQLYTKKRLQEASFRNEIVSCLGAVLDSPEVF
jgi:hypothetical protein